MEALVGVVIGAILGLTGAGGSVFAVPILIYIIELSPQDAMGMSLGIVGISAIFGVLSKLKSRQILWYPGFVFAGLGSLFAPVGVYLNRKSDETLLLVGFSLIVLIVAIRMFRQNSHQSNFDMAEENRNLSLRTLLPTIGMAIFTGLLSGLFGVGGGFLIVPTLVIVLRIRIQTAIATSLFIISIVSLSGFWSFINAEPDFNKTGLLLKIICGGIFGMQLGNGIGKNLPSQTLSKIFAILMLVMAVFVLGSTLVKSS